MNFEKQQMSSEIFQEEIESLQSQLKEMRRLFFQAEEKITRDLTILRDKINFQMNENETHKNHIESDDAMNELIQNHIDGISPSDDKMRRMDDNILDEKKKNILKQDEVADDDKFSEHPSRLSRNKRRQETPEQDENINSVEGKSNDINCQESEYGGHMMSAATQKISNKAEVAIDDNVVEGENSERFDDTLPANIVEHNQNSSITERMSVDTFYTVKSALTSRRLTIDRLFRNNGMGNNQDDEPYKSSSFHMYAVGILTDSTKSNRRGWVVTFLSVAFTFLQFIVLTTVVYEASHPTCAAHDDCRFGEYCDFGKQWKGNSRCEDCTLHKQNATNCSSYLSDTDILDYNHPDYVEVDYTKLADGINLDEYNDTVKDCLVQIHCDETDVINEKCDFLALNQVMWHGTQKLVFLFMSLLYAVLLCRDLQDAIAEETYINMGLQNNSLNPSKKMASEFLRVAIRSRQLILPWYSTSAAIAIIISEPLTAQNMLLNFLTIEVILVSDDMFAILVLPLLHQDSTDKLMNLVAEKGVKVSYVWSRVISIVASLLLVLTVFNFNFVMDLYDGQTQTYQTCGDIGQSLEMFINLTLPLCACVVHGIGVSFVKKAANLTKRIMLGFGQVLIDLTAWTVACTAWAIVLATTTWQEPVVIILPIVVSYKVLYFVGHTLRIYWSWKPVLNAHQALYDE